MLLYKQFRKVFARKGIIILAVILNWNCPPNRALCSPKSTIWRNNWCQIPGRIIQRTRLTSMLWRNVSFDNQLMILSTQYGTICKGTYGQITIYSKFIGACAQSFLQNQSYNGTTGLLFILVIGPIFDMFSFS